MHIISIKKLRDFWERHPAAELSMRSWYSIVKKEVFRSFVDLRRCFPSADYVRPFTVFNVGGNNFRIISVIHYNRMKVYVREVFTHQEYDRWEP